MFGEFLSIVFKSIKLDKSLYSDNKNFGEGLGLFCWTYNDLRWNSRCCRCKHSH
jgi:hypothetical protein